MKIHLTKHCLQRREHYQKEDPSIIKHVFNEVIKNIDVFTRTALENKIYKINYKYFCCVFKKEDDKYIIITIRGHKKLIEKNHLDKPRLNLANAAFKSTGGYIIRRVNYLQRTVKCGYVIAVAGTDMRLLQIQKNLYKKFNIPSHIPRTGLKFKEDSDIESLVYFNESEQCYYLRDFERNEEYSEYKHNI